MLLTPIGPRSLTLMELEKGINFYTLLHVLHGQNIFVYLVYFVVKSLLQFPKRERLYPKPPQR